MKIRDKTLGVHVDVYSAKCPAYRCYWPRPDPGIFVQGCGYRSRTNGNGEYLCGTREIRGCPKEPELNDE